MFTLHFHRLVERSIQGSSDWYVVFINIHTLCSLYWKGLITDERLLVLLLWSIKASALKFWLMRLKQTTFYFLFLFFAWHMSGPPWGQLWTFVPNCTLFHSPHSAEKPMQSTVLGPRVSHFVDIAPSSGILKLFYYSFSTSLKSEYNVPVWNISLTYSFFVVSGLLWRKLSNTLLMT